MHYQNLKPLIFWEGLPPCALLLKKILKEYPNIVLVATRPSVPFKDMELLLQKDIFWLDDPSDIWRYRQNFADRNLVIHTGWNHKGWLRYGNYVKNRNKAKVVVVVDNRFKRNMRQLFGSIYFRLFLRSYFDAAFVPGREGVKLLNFFGMPKNRIYVGNYGAFEKIYYETKPIMKRSNEFLFVGQFIERKGVDILIEAFRRYRLAGGTWNLRMIGRGKLFSKCHGEGIISKDFLQPTDICKAMNDSKVFVLVSRDEHWGTVVCEAAACGMSLITNKNVGSSVDLVRNGINGIELQNNDIEELIDAFFYFEKMDSEILENASKVSKGIAKGYDSMAYASSIKKIFFDLFADKD